MTQSKALAILKAGHNVFLTGSAGAGKTYVLNQYIQYLKERKVAVAITASTGIAATHMNGQTIHSWAGIGIKENITLQHLQRLKEKKFFRDKMDAVKVLIIDEISMLHRNQLDLVNQALKYFKENQSPFGGIQVVFSGDFFQLPPIGKEYETSRDKFAFMSTAWLEANLAICYLTEQHRQINNPLTQVLNEIRSGEVSQQAINLLASRIDEFPDEDSGETKLFTHNASVNKINQSYLKKINANSHFFEASYKGNKNLVEVLKKSILAEEKLELKVGAQVMFIRNNYEEGYINGTLGAVTSINSKGIPMVKTRDNELLEAKHETWAIEDEFGKPLASISQIPLRLAWAITVHKSQGMTLDAATIDLSYAFEQGQGYVALSRLKNLEGLRLKGLNKTALEIDELAQRADARFKELAQELDDSTDEKELEKSFNNFILYCGGIVNKEEVEKRKKTLKNKNVKKLTTYDVTQQLLEKKMSVHEIAKERNLSQDTIWKHVYKILEKNKNLNINHLKPDPDLLEKVKQAVDLQKGEEKILLKKIYEDLNEEIDYELIKQALIFVI